MYLDLLFSYFSNIVNRIESKFQNKMGYLYLLLGCHIQIIATITIKSIKHISVFQVMVVRAIFVIILNYFITKQCGIQHYSSKSSINRQTQIISFLSYTALISYFYGIVLMSISEGIVLHMTSPVITGIFSKFILGEKYEKIQLITTILAFTGVLLIAKPDFLFSLDSAKYQDYPHRGLGAFFVLYSACSTGLVQVLIKKSSHSTNSLSILQLSTTFALILSALFGIYDKIPVRVPNLSELFSMVLIGMFGWAGQLSWMRAFYFSKAGKVSIIQYYTIVLSLVVDCLLYMFIPDVFSIIGTLLICTSIISLIVQINKKTES